MSLPGCFACLAEIDKTSYFTGFSYFGATGGHGGSLHFFSPAQYLSRLLRRLGDSPRLPQTQSHLLRVATPVAP